MSNSAKAMKKDADETVFSPRESEPAADLVDLTNQLVIIFGSFSLGSLEHITKLIKFYGKYKAHFLNWYKWKRIQ